MTPIRNSFIRLVKSPLGKPTTDIFEVETDILPPLKNNEFLIKNCFVSIDPALISRMRQEDNYTDSINVGDIMHAYAVGQVIASRNSKVKNGEVRFGRFDMQEYFISEDETSSTVINTGVAEAKHYLSIVGTTGVTAYFGFFDVCQPKKGETIVISSGGSSVGSIVAQLAKKIGCTTIGIVSTEAKAKYIKQNYPYDAVVSYKNKSIEELRNDLSKVCNKGVDMYYDNTSGDISEALMGLYNDFARIAVIGRLGISHINNTKDDTGRRDNNEILTKRIKKQGMVVLDYKRKKLIPAVLRLAKWTKTGKIRFNEDILEGVEQLPTAFFRMVEGKNKGKQLVKLADIKKRQGFKENIGKLITSKYFPTEILLKPTNWL